MLKTEQFPTTFSKLGLECPSTTAAQAKNPPGTAPSIRDSITLHIPLPIDSELRDEVEAKICPAVGQSEQFLDEHEGEDKPGSFRFTVSKKKWGTYNIILRNIPDGPVVLRMEGAALKGKPAVLFNRDVEPVLEFTFRGALTDGDGNTSDQIRRQYVHSLLYCTLAPTQAALNDSEKKELEHDLPPGSCPEFGEVGHNVEEVDGSTEVGGRPDALPEHSFKTEVIQATCAALDKQFPGFAWGVIQGCKAYKTGEKIVIGWAELTAEASKRGAIGDLKAERKKAEAV